MKKFFTTVTMAALVAGFSPAAMPVLAQNAPTVRIEIDPEPESTLESITSFTITVSGASTVAKKNFLVNNAVEVTGPDGFKDNPNYSCLEGFPQILVNGLDIQSAGTYTLTIPAGTFVYTVEGDETKYDLEAINASYTISSFERPVAEPAEGPLFDGKLNRITLRPADGDKASDFNVTDKCNIFKLDSEGNPSTEPLGEWSIVIGETTESAVVLEETNGGVTLDGGHYRLYLPAGLFKINGENVPQYTLRYNVPVNVDASKVVTGWGCDERTINPIVIRFSGNASVNPNCTEPVAAYYGDETEPRFVVPENKYPYITNNRQNDMVGTPIPNEIRIHFGEDELGDVFDFDTPGIWRVDIPANLILVDGDYVGAFSHEFEQVYRADAIIDPKPVDASIEGTGPFDTITIEFPTALSVKQAIPLESITDSNSGGIDGAGSATKTIKVTSITCEGNIATIKLAEKVESTVRDSSSSDHTIQLPDGLFELEMTDVTDETKTVTIYSNFMNLQYHMALFKPEIRPGKVIDSNTIEKFELLLPEGMTVKSFFQNGFNYIKRVNSYNNIIHMPKLAAFVIDEEATLNQNKVVFIPRYGTGVTLEPGRYCFNTGPNSFTTNEDYTVPEFYFIFEITADNLKPIARPDIEPAEDSNFEEFPTQFQLLFPGNETLNAATSEGTAFLAGMWFIPEEGQAAPSTSAACYYTPTITQDYDLQGNPVGYDYHSLTLTSRGTLSGALPGRYELRCPARMFTTTTGISSAYVYNFTYKVEPENSVDGITDEPETITVYTLTGVRVLNNADRSQLRNLAKGIYIVNGKKVMVR